MSARFWTPRLEVIEEECEIENIIFSEGALNEKGNSRFENERDDKRVKTKGEDRIKLDGKKRDENTLGGKSANATGKQENKKEEKSGDEKRENQRDEGK